MGRMDVTVVGAVKTSVSVAVAELMLVPVTVMVLANVSHVWAL